MKDKQTGPKPIKDSDVVPNIILLCYRKTENQKGDPEYISLSVNFKQRDNHVILFRKLKQPCCVTDLPDEEVESTVYEVLKRFYLAKKKFNDALFDNSVEMAVKSRIHEPFMAASNEVDKWPRVKYYRRSDMCRLMFPKDDEMAKKFEIFIRDRESAKGVIKNFDVCVRQVDGECRTFSGQCPDEKEKDCPFRETSISSKAHVYATTTRSKAAYPYPFQYYENWKSVYLYIEQNGGNVLNAVNAVLNHRKQPDMKDFNRKEFSRLCSQFIDELKGMGVSAEKTKAINDIVSEIRTSMFR